MPYFHHPHREKMQNCQFIINQIHGYLKIWRKIQLISTHNKFPFRNKVNEQLENHKRLFKIWFDVDRDRNTFLPFCCNLLKSKVQLWKVSIPNLTPQKLSLVTLLRYETIPRQSLTILLRSHLANIPLQTQVCEQGNLSKSILIFAKID